MREMRFDSSRVVVYVKPQKHIVSQSDSVFADSNILSSDVYRNHTKISHLDTLFYILTSAAAAAAQLFAIRNIICPEKRRSRKNPQTAHTSHDDVMNMYDCV